MTQKRKDEILDIVLDWATEVIDSGDLLETLHNSWGLTDDEIRELGMDWAFDDEDDRDEMPWDYGKHFDS